MAVPRLSSMAVGERVGEIVGVLAAFDDDVHGAGEALKLATAGIWNDGDGELVGAVGHGADVLKDEGACAAAQGAAHALYGDVTSRALGGTAGSEHFAFTGGLEVTVELLVDGHAADGVLFKFESGLEGKDFYFERAGSVLGHESVLL